MKAWMLCLAMFCFAATAGAQRGHMGGPPVTGGAGFRGGAGFHAPIVSNPVPPMITPGTHVVQQFLRPAQPHFRAGFAGVPGAVRQGGFRRGIGTPPGLGLGYSYPYVPTTAGFAPYYDPYFYDQPFVPQPPSVPQPEVVPDYPASDDLTIQIQQLSDEVRDLRNQMMETRAIPVPQPEVRPAVPPPPPSPPVVLIFRNGRQIETQGYAIIGPQLWVINGAGSAEFALSDLDVAATKAENLKRGNTFRLP